MKPTLRQLAIGILVMGGLLAGCSGTPTDDEPLPTLAVLPSLTPSVSFVEASTSTPQPTALETKAPSDATSETNLTPNPIVLPSPLDESVTPTSVEAFGFTVFPAILQVGDELTLEGVLTTDDVDGGKAILTNDTEDTVNLLLDPFTATMGNNQRVQITGIVEAQPDSVENAIRVSAINLLEAMPLQEELADPLAGLELTSTPTTP